MKQYIFSALCLVSGAFCLSSCNDDKEARPYTPDYEIVPEYTNADTWKAYEAFNEHLLDQNKFIYKSSSCRPLEWCCRNLVSADLLGYGNECL